MVQQKNFMAKANAKFEPLEHSITTVGNMEISLSKQLKMVENQVGQLANVHAEIHKPG